MFKINHIPEIDSTHKWALREIKTGFQGRILLSSDFQTDGIGRKETPWIAPKGSSLLLSFIFPAPPKDVSTLAQLLSFSQMKVLEELQLHPLFKWPNDILLSLKKVGGAMAEIVDSMALCSIGLNINIESNTLAKFPFPATSLLNETHSLFSLSDLRDRLNRRFSSDLSLFTQQGFAPFFTPFKEKLAFRLRHVRIGKIEGILKDLHKDGRIILQIDGIDHILSDGSLELVK